MAWRVYKDVRTFDEFDALVARGRVAERDLVNQVMVGGVRFSERAMAALAARHVAQERLADDELERLEREIDGLAPSQRKRTGPITS